MSVDKFGRRLGANNFSSDVLRTNLNGNFDIDDKRIINIGNPIASTDAVNKLYVDTAIYNIEKRVDNLKTETEAKIIKLKTDILNELENFKHNEDYYYKDLKKHLTEKVDTLNTLRSTFINNPTEVIDLEIKKLKNILKKDEQNTSSTGTSQTSSETISTSSNNN